MSIHYDDDGGGVGVVGGLTAAGGALSDEDSVR